MTASAMIKGIDDECSLTEFDRVGKYKLGRTPSQPKPRK